MTAPRIVGIHHLKFPVADIERAQQFYETAFFAARLQALDHISPEGKLFAIILDVPGLGTMLELRLAPDFAATQKGFDPLTLAVETHGDLETWRAHFDAKGIDHSPILVGFLGWVLVSEDPDGRRIRLYTKEARPAHLSPSRSERWL